MLEDTIIAIFIIVIAFFIFFFIDTCTSKKERWVYNENKKDNIPYWIDEFTRADGAHFKRKGKLREEHGKEENNSELQFVQVKPKVLPKGKSKGSKKHKTHVRHRRKGVQSRK